MSAPKLTTAQRTAELREVALREGTRYARKLFEKRGNHSEMHLREAELAAMLVVAFELGALHAGRAALKDGAP